MLRRQLVRSIRSFNTPVYHFNEVIQTPSEVEQRLKKTLNNEIKYEQENYQHDETVDESIQSNGFKLIDKQGMNTMELQKQTDGVSVRVIFQSRAPTQPEEEEEGQQQQEEQQEMEDFCDFQVILTKQNNNLVYECSSLDSELHVQYVTFTDNVDKFLAQSKIDRMTHNYNGPEFGTLDEKLQNDMMEYLRSVGINEEIAAIVEHLSLDKEQRMYQQWLNQVNDFLV